MSTVLVALDASTGARAVLETAVRVGELTGAHVEAVHVHADPRECDDTLEALAARIGVPLKLLEPPVEPALIAAMGEPDVIVAVIGTGGAPGYGRPVGHTATSILESVDKPVVVVPPEAVSPGTMVRLLVPLEGTEASSRPVRERLVPLLVADADVVALHVFTDTTLPAMLDRPHRDLDMLGSEFLARHLPRANRIELRTGPVATWVTEVSEEYGSDLIVLSWSQSLSPGRSHVVREVLGDSHLPVLLLPIVPTDINEADAVSPPVDGDLA